MKKSLLVTTMLTALAIGGLTGCGGSSADFSIGVSQFVAVDALNDATRGFMDRVKEGMAKAGKSVEFDVQLEEGKPKCHVIAVFDDRDEEKVAQIENNIFKVNKLEKPDEVYSLREFEEILQTIGLKTVLIVHQRQGITNNNPRNQSLSAATDNPFMFLKYGYFDSLEYNHPRVEGIVKSSLRDLNLYYPLITGSDCHQWDAYPYHDMRGGTNRDFTKLKCMPSFMGLVMSVSSFSTRSNRRVRTCSTIESCLIVFIIAFWRFPPTFRSIVFALTMDL